MEEATGHGTRNRRHVCTQGSLSAAVADPHHPYQRGIQNTGSDFDWGEDYSDFSSTGESLCCSRSADAVLNQPKKAMRIKRDIPLGGQKP